MARTKGSKNKPKEGQQSGTGQQTQVLSGAVLAKIESKDIVDFLNKRSKEFESYAIRTYRQHEFMLSANIAISESPKLRAALKTGVGQRSLYHALRSAAATGLSLNPQQGKAALVPYKNQNGDLIVSYQIMKGGLIDLIMETGQVADLVSDLVREADEFNIERTDKGDTYHFSPARRQRGGIDGYFAAIMLKNGRTHVNYMSIEETAEHEKRYNSSKTLGDKSAWVRSREGMSIKTVIKKLLRNIHLSEVTGAAISVDDHAEFGSDVIDVDAEPVTVREAAPKSTPDEMKPPDGETDQAPTETKPGNGETDPASGETNQKGATADDVAGQLDASDAAADEQGTDEPDDASESAI